ncbi:MAG: hypothetical protein ACKO13_05335 [Cytophagales bacterium]
MKTKEQCYGKLLIAISVAALVFHLLIVIKVIPYAITWGGRLKTDSEMYLFETVSIGINLFFIFLVLQRVDMERSLLGKKTATILLWIFFVLFGLNTIGNIFATTPLEQWFSLLTLANAFLIWKINRR